MFRTVQLCKGKLQNIKHGEYLSTQHPQDNQWLTEGTPFSLAHCFKVFTWPKGDRGLGKHESEVVLRKTGVFIQPGSEDSEKSDKPNKRIVLV